MRKIILILISIFTLFSVGAQSQNPEYDSSLAKKLGTNVRGLFIPDVKTIDEAKELLKNNPSINLDILRAVYYTWNGSAALPVYLEAADKIWKKSP